MFEVLYIGCSSQMLRMLLESPLFDVMGVVGESDRMNSEQRYLVEMAGLAYWEVASSSELVALPILSDASQNIIVYKFDYILKEELVARHRIVNFHPGDLRTNRGPHPRVWSVLNRDSFTKMSLYELTGGIDEGLLIAEETILLSSADDALSIEEKCLMSVPGLLAILERYFAGEIGAKPMEGGVYLPKVREPDYTILPGKDTIETISAKIRSQRGYNGAIIHRGANRYRIKYYAICEAGKSSESNCLFQDEMFIVVQDGRKMVCHLLPESEM